MVYVFTYYFELFSETEVKNHLKNFSLICPPEEHSEKEIVDYIRRILNPIYRRYLKVFQLGSGDSLTNVIFRAVLESMRIHRTLL